jgi:hypothetical protein
MKQQDIAVLIIIVFIAGIASFFVSSKVVTPNSKKLSAEVVTPITTDFQLPEKRHFNEQSINPTVRIEIAPNTNPQPFANESQ